MHDAQGDSLQRKRSTTDYGGLRTQLGAPNDLDRGRQASFIPQHQSPAFSEEDLRCSPCDRVRPPVPVAPPPPSTPDAPTSHESLRRQGRCCRPCVLWPPRACKRLPRNRSRRPTGASTSASAASRCAVTARCGRRLFLEPGVAPMRGVVDWPVGGLRHRFMAPAKPAFLGCMHRRTKRSPRQRLARVSAWRRGLALLFDTDPTHSNCPPSPPAATMPEYQASVEQDDSKAWVERGATQIRKLAR